MTTDYDNPYDWVDSQGFLLKQVICANCGTTLLNPFIPRDYPFGTTRVIPRCELCKNLGVIK